MRELRRPAPPLARLLIVALGLLGVVAGPAGAGTHGGTTATGLVASARSGAAQQAPARPRASAKQRLDGPVRSATTATRLAHATQPVSGAQLVHAVQVAPLVFAGHHAHAALPATGVGVRPSSGRVSRADAVPGSPDVPPTGVPRGRAPPSLPRI